MGLSFHYSGSIKSTASIDQLIGEVSDICKELEWPMHTYDDEVKGISFAPSKCETVFLTFNPDGRLLSPISILTDDIYEKNGIDKELKFTTSTKTQFAGPDTHIAILKLLKYISKKYLKDFKLSDEGNYWETEDEKVLIAQFKRYDFLLNMVADALKDFPAKASDTPQSLAKRLEEYLKKITQKQSEN